MAKFFVIFILSIGLVCGFNVNVRNRRQIEKPLVYPKNSIFEAFFLNLRPDESAASELRNLKYPTQPLFFQFFSNASRFLFDVQNRFNGIAKQLNLDGIGSVVSGLVQNVVRILGSILRVRHFWSLKFNF
jgi:hypothetical protein